MSFKKTGIGRLIVGKMVVAFILLTCPATDRSQVTKKPQPIKKLLKAAIRADKRLQWSATELFQSVLDSRGFPSLSVPEKLNVYDRLCWLYYVEKKYRQAELPAQEAVRLRESVQNQSSSYTEALQWLAKTQLALGKYRDSQDSYRRSFEAFERFNEHPSPYQKWDILVGWGRSYYLDGNPSEAISYYEQAFGLLSAGVAVNDTHFEKSVALRELANMYRDRCDLEKAEELYMRSIAIMDSGVYANRHIRVWDEVRIANLGEYARFLHIQNRTGDAGAVESRLKIIKDRYK